MSLTVYGTLKILINSAGCGFKFIYKSNNFANIIYVLCTTCIDLKNGKKHFLDVNS